MSNLVDYKAAFIEAFDIDEGELDSLSYQAIDAWDSVGHMQLVAALEDAYDIMLDTDDIIDLSSFQKGKEILRKYDVEVE